MEKHDDRDLSQAPTSRSDAHSANMLYVGILLVVIIGLLAVLWTRERRLRVVAEQRAVRLHHENQTLRKAMAAIGVFQSSATRPGGS